jgi:hypothetical protein
VDYGLEEAIMIWNFRFWIIKNKANNKHFYENKTWTYNSHEAFQKLFPFWTKDQVRRIIEKLLKKEIIVKGNFNQSAYNKTAWYAFKDEEKFMAQGLVFSYLANLPDRDGENAKSKWQKQKMEMAETKNGDGKNATSNTDLKPNIKPYLFLEEKQKNPSLEEIKKYCSENKKNIDAEKFFNFYKSKGWMIGKNPMIDWCASIDIWVKDSKNHISQVTVKERKKEPLEIENLRINLKRELITNQLDYDLLFASNEIEKINDGFLMYYKKDSYKSSYVEKYDAILKKLKIKLSFIE